MAHEKSTPQLVVLQCYFGISLVVSRSAAYWTRTECRVPFGDYADLGSVNCPGTIKAFHYHLHQTDCWTPVKGMFQVALVDLRLNSPTFGKRNTIYVGSLRPWHLLIPPGVAHGYKVIGSDEALLVYLTDRFYNPRDEGRIPYDDPSVAYDWDTQHK